MQHRKPRHRVLSNEMTFAWQSPIHHWLQVGLKLIEMQKQLFRGKLHEWQHLLHPFQGQNMPAE